MTIDKNISIDLARVQPHRIIKIHEGDVNSVFVVLSVTNGGASVALKDKTIKYDATIAGYLAEQDADGSVDNDNTIRIPVTSNMTAMSGTLKIDVKIKEDDEVLFIQTITLIVEKAVINDSTIIDFSGITIAQRFNELDESVDSLNNAINAMDSDQNGKVNIKAVVDDAIDTADEYNTIYLHRIGSNYRGLVFFSGYSNYAAGVSVTQFRLTRDQGFQYRTGISQGSHQYTWDKTYSEQWTPIADDKVDKSTLIAGLSLEGDISVSALAEALADALFEALYLEDYAALADESKPGVIDLKQVKKGQYYYSEERGVIGIKTSEATDISSETAPTYIEAYTTDKIDDMLGDVESLLAQI